MAEDLYHKRLQHRAHAVTGVLVKTPPLGIDLCKVTGTGCGCDVGFQQ